MQNTSSLTAQKFTFIAESRHPVQMPSTLQLTIRSIIHSRLDMKGIEAKAPLESAEERSLRKYKKHQQADLTCLNEIVKKIDIFNQSTKEEERASALYEMGELAGKVKFNDLQDYKERYLRNKYGSLDRSNNSKRREGGLELIHLKALQHLPASFFNVENLESLSADLVLIKKKILFISTAESSNLPDEEIQSELKKLGVAKKIQSFVNANYVKVLSNELLKHIKDPELEKLDFSQRMDRYYLGRTLCIIGELSKELREFLNPEKEGGLFSFFKKIRDKKLAHHHSALVSTPSPEQIGHFNLLISLLKKFELIVENAPEKGLGGTSEVEKQQLNRFMDSIFGKEFVEADLAIIKGIDGNARPVKNVSQLDVKEKEKAKLEKRNLITTLDQIYDKVDRLLNGKKVISQKKATFGQEVFMPLPNKTAELVRKEVKRLVDSYNEAELPDDLKLNHNEIPSLECLLAKKTAIEQMQLQDLELEVKKEVKAPLVTASVAVDEKTPAPQVDLAKTHKELEKALSSIAKEFEYVKTILSCNEMNEERKKHIIDFAMTKIGQIFVDSKKEREQVLSVFSKDHRKSIKEITRNRHQLMHEILTSSTVDRPHLLFRQALPIMPEIEALKRIVAQDLTGEHALLTLGRAYTEMKCYDKAIECFDQMLQLAGSHFFSGIFSNEDLAFFGQASNALLGIAEAYGQAAQDAASDEETESYYRLKIASFQQHLKLLSQVDDIEKPVILPDQIASINNNMGNVYSYLHKTDRALECFKKALKILKKQKKGNLHREAIYLFNIGKTYLKECLNNLSDPLPSEIQRQFTLAAAALWEANEIYTHLPLEPYEKEMNPLYFNIRMNLIEALFFSHLDYSCFATKLYHELEKSLEKFPIRETDPRMEYIGRLKKLKEIIHQENSRKENLISENEMQFILLQNLKPLFVELELDCTELDGRAKKIIQKGQINQAFIDEEIYFDKNVKASQLFREGKPKQALPLYLEALKLLETNFQHLQTQTRGDLLENIADTYETLGELKKALDYFKLSLEAHFLFVPNDRAFKIPLKCMNIISKTNGSHALELNLIFFKQTVSQFLLKVGKNDPRMRVLLEVNSEINKMQNTKIEIFQKYSNRLDGTKRYLLIPKREVKNFKAFQEDCQNFLKAGCREDKGNYKIFLNELGKCFLQSLE